MMRLLAMLMLFGAQVGIAGESPYPVAARELTFQDFFATRPGDTRTYLVLGSGWLQALSVKEPGKHIARWLKAHPAAKIKPVCRNVWSNASRGHPEESVYIWLVDGAASLNVDLIQNGIYPGGVMIDIVDNAARTRELLKDSRLADAAAEVEREFARTPPEMQRLVSDSEYAALLEQIHRAELEARRHKLGIWSDAMKQERENDGIS